MGPGGQPAPERLAGGARGTAGLSVFDAHLAACAGRLATVDVERGWSGQAAGKAVVFATAASVARDTEDWPGRGIRDVPTPGDEIDAGHPICTLLAGGETPLQTVETLERRTADLRAEISGWAVAHA